MFLQSHHINNIAKPKRSENRGFEDDIESHPHVGDQTSNDGNGSYRYLNRPLPQPGLHLLHPTIDSANVFLTETPWDPNWHYTRDDIPNVILPEHVDSHRKRVEEYHVNDYKKKMEDRERDLKNRHLPQFQQIHVPGQHIPAFHSHNNPGHPYYNYGEERTPIKDYSNIENFVHVGFRGNQSPHPYSKMGEDCGYDHQQKENTSITQHPTGTKEFFSHDKETTHSNYSFPISWVFLGVAIVFFLIFCVFSIQ